VNARPDLARRLEREREAHGERDVLAANRRLKSRFPHVETYPARLRTFGRIDAACLDLRGLRLLDLGCGEGERCLDYAERGAAVHAIDLSEGYVERTLARVAGSRFADRVEARVMDAHALDFPDAWFDLVIGCGVLHHLDWRLALSEVRRVLRPSGRAWFQEPLADNPLLRLFRWVTPGARTVDERPFSASDLDEIERLPAWTARLHGCGIVSAPLAMITSLAPRLSADNAVLRAADRLERHWADRPAWRSWNQYVVIELEPR
jgi:SAM-dependent methyltransferase